MPSVLDLIGDTPLVEVTQLDAAPCRLFLKLESANPSGSIKDRPARAMIEAAETDGRLKPGGTIVEATAGNTGLGLALVGGRRGYRTVLVVPDKMAREKILHARAMGVEVVLTRSDVGKGHPDYYQDLAEMIAGQTPGAIYINQFANPANPRAHETGTGPELIAQMEGDIDAVVVGVGSGGTLTGVGRCMKSRSPMRTLNWPVPDGSSRDWEIRWMPTNAPSTMQRSPTLKTLWKGSHDGTTNTSPRNSRWGWMTAREFTKCLGAASSPAARKAERAPGMTPPLAAMTTKFERAPRHTSQRPGRRRLAHRKVAPRT